MPRRARVRFTTIELKALGGGQRDAGLDGSLRPASQFAIVPNAIHYTLAVDPMLPQIVERFLATT